MILGRYSIIWPCFLLFFSHGAVVAEVYAIATCRDCCQRKSCYGVRLDPGCPEKPRRDKPGDVNRGDCPPRRYSQCDHDRAGMPCRVAPWATCSVHHKYSGFFVGGGAAFAKIPQPKLPLLDGGRSRTANGCSQYGEGTWGLDYNGYFGNANVWLRYTQGRKQGGEGAYKTDGEPKFISKLKSLVHRE